MSNFAKVINGVVETVIVAEQEFVDNYINEVPCIWVKAPEILERGAFPSSGYTYNAEHNVFYPPQPYPSWSLDNVTFQWTPPVPMPEHNEQECFYDWDESLKNWVKYSKIG